MQDDALKAMARALAKSEYSGGGEWRAYISDAQAALAAYHAHLAEQGLVIVPEVPTEAMVDVGFDALWGVVERFGYLYTSDARDCYAAMIQAVKDRSGGI